MKCLNCNMMLSLNNKTGYCTIFCKRKHLGDNYVENKPVISAKPTAIKPMEIVIWKHEKPTKRTYAYTPESMIDDLIIEDNGNTIKDYLELKSQLDKIKQTL